jgi:hypothetical protein
VLVEAVRVLVAVEDVLVLKHDVDCAVDAIQVLECVEHGKGFYF